MIRDILSGKQFVRIAQGMDMTKLVDEIQANEELFELSKFRQNFKGSPFKATTFIPCRMSYDLKGEVTEEELIEHLKTKGINEKEASDTELYYQLPEVYNAVMTLAYFIKAERIGRVLVTKLFAGGTIGAHKDFGEYHDYYDRFHIVVSGKGCDFRSGNEWVRMLPGEVWWFYNNDEHEVHNNTDEDRIHIVMDFKLRGNKECRE